MHPLLATGMRFASVGVVNTFIGYSVIMIGLFLGWTDILANASGYAIGLCITFFANRSWTFRQSGRADQSEIIRFFITFLLAWLSNIALISIGMNLGYAGNPLLHLCGIGVYSATFFMLSNNFIYCSQAPGISLHHIMPLSAVIAGGAVYLAILFGLPLTHDVTWQLWIARQINGGTSLYGQIIELNPPLWFWMARPIDGLANITNISPSNILITAMVMIAMGSAVLTGWIGQFRTAMERTIAMQLVLAIIMLICLYDFGQREHILLATTIPYTVLLSRRFNGDKIAVSLSLIIGLFAAPGFALKHYFAIVPIALELMLLFKLRKNYNPFRPETLTLAIAAIAYIIAILVFAPAFLTDIYPMVQAAYFGYEVPIHLWFDEPAQAFWGLSICAMLMAFKKHYRPLTAAEWAFGVSAFGFFLVYLVQKKGWQYHAIPASGMLVMLLAARLFDKNCRYLDIFSTIMQPLTILVFFAVSLWQGPYTNLYIGHYKWLFESVGKNAKVMLIVTNPQWAWPNVEEYQLRWSSRYFAHWMIPAIGYNRVNNINNPNLDSMAKEVLEKTYLDIACHQPEFIMVDKKIVGHSIMPPQYSSLQFLKENDDLYGYIHRHYTVSQQDILMMVFRKNEDGAAPLPKDCDRVFQPI